MVSDGALLSPEPKIVGSAGECSVSMKSTLLTLKSIKQNSGACPCDGEKVKLGTQ